MRLARRRLCERLLVAALGVLAAFGAAAQPTRTGESRIVAIGDVHGAYDAFVALLSAAGLVDQSLNWSGGDARLVVLGDVLDRGAGSRRALELVVRLREQAARAGGDAQLVLGNHEVMNLIGELSYVTPAELAAYAPDEEPAEREAAWQRFRAANAEGDQASLAAVFAERFPPGFFGHRAAFAPRGRLGAWLLQRPVLAVAGRTVFVHGGLPPAVIGKTADEINRSAGSALRDYLAAVDTLRDAGMLQVETPFGDRAPAAAAFLEARGRTATADAVSRAAERVRDFARSPLFGNDAVFWYRGTAACNPALERGRLDRELRMLGADRVIIGHTPTSDARVQTRFDGAVVRADTGMLASYFRGRASAVVIRGNDVRALYADSGEELVPEPQPRSVGPSVPSLDDDALANFLATASIAGRTPLKDGAQLLHLERGAVSADAVFRPADAPRRGPASLPEVAAYRLDRLLELDVVPVTVRREVDGRVGSLQLPVDDLPDDRRRTAEQRSDAFCPLLDQFNVMYTFDALARNEGRAPTAIRYEAASWQLVLTDNRAAFGTGSDLPSYLRDVKIDVPEWLVTRLGQLNRAALDERLSDVLDDRQRGAILTRRDRLLGKTTTAR